jgi:hypothetical protein
LDYSIHKQTYSELESKYNKSSRTLRKYFDQLQDAPFPSPIDCIPEINLTFDTTFFGRNFGVMVFRTPGINLLWEFVESEAVYGYKHCLSEHSHKFKFLSFTIDGKLGVRKMLEASFPEVPVQLCKFHQVAIVRRYTTQRPKTECGKAILRLAKSLKSFSESEFRDQLKQVEDEFREFLNEKNENGRWKHDRLRSAIRSLKGNLEYLFTHERYPELNIPTTTNSCDGSFAHWKDKVRFHRGISTEIRKQMISQFLS